MNFGWIALDERCRIVELDAQAERLLERMGRACGAAPMTAWSRPSP